MRGETFFNVVAKAIGSLRTGGNYLCLKLLCGRVGRNVRAIEIPKITGGARISIGDNVFIGRGVQLIVPEQGQITIGDGAEIRDGVRLYAKSIIIEPGVTVGENSFLVGNVHLKEQCWVSRGCDLTGDIEVGRAILGPRVACVSSDHGKDENGAVLIDKTAASAKITIEDGSWMGMNAIILKGVTIGKNAVVGAGSVVTKAVPAGSVVAGVPAKPIQAAS
jgi:acetyltransferase-like isoleucine patch superfamily enzyme